MGDCVVELVFDISETDILLVEASRAESCSIRLQEVHQRSDGTVLEYLTVEDAAADQLTELAASADRPFEMRVLSETDGRVVLEVISESPIATALADEHTRVTDIAATTGQGRLVAEVPPHVDASRVADSFLQQYPDAELLARRETDREVPTLTAAQFQQRLLAPLTDRQIQALRTAYARGYFERPRGTTAAEIAAELDVSDSTFIQHLRVAQEKVLARLFGDEQL